MENCIKNENSSLGTEKRKKPKTKALNNKIA